MKAETLKKAILQYAMQGKLVKQDPEDEPASVLLKRIRAEKEQLIKDGKIKKEKPLPLITEDEIPYELPKGWEWVKVQDLLYLKSGDTIAQGLEIQNGDLLYLKVGDMNLNIKYVDKSSRSVNSTNINKNSIIPPRSIIFPKRGGAIATNKKQITLKPILVDLNVMAACCPKDLNIEYLYYWFLSFDLSTLNTGTSVPQINNKDIYPLLFPLPPLAEQERIVEKLEQILPLVEEYGKNEEKLSKLNSTLPDKIKQSILQHAVQGKLVPQNPSDEPASELLKRIKAEKEQLIKDGKIKKEKILPPITEDEIPYELPRNWSYIRLGDLCTINPRNYVEDELEVGFVPMTLVNDGYKGGHKYEKRKWKDIKSGFTHFQTNDVVVAKITPCFQNRKSTVISELPNNIGAGTTELHVIRDYTNTINMKYLLLVVKTEMFIREGVKNFTGTAGQQRVGKDFISNYIVPLPPLAEQQRIVTKVEELLAIVNKLK